MKEGEGMTLSETSRLIKWLKEKGYAIEEILELLEYIANCKS